MEQKMITEQLSDKIRYFEVQKSFIEQQPVSETDKAHKLKLLANELKQTFNIPDTYDIDFNRDNKEVVQLYRKLISASNVTL